MKEYISSHWKKILFIICGLVVFIDLVLIFITPNNVVSDYYKYGPVIENKIIDVDVDGNALVERTAEETGTNFDTAKLIVVFIALIAGCLILDDVMQGKEKKK